MEDGITIAVAGITGCGKTSWVRQNLREEARLILIDTRGEHGWLPAWKPEREDGSMLGSLLRQISRYGPDAPFQLRIIPPGDEARSGAWIEYIGKQAYHSGNVTVVLEEADLFSSPDWENDGVKVMHNYARNRGVTLVYLVRVVNSVNRLMTANTKGWVLFRLQEPRYLEQLDARFDFDIVSEVGSLKDLEYIQVNPDRTWTRGIVTP